jgi:hypothetical protein
MRRGRVPWGEEVATARRLVSMFLRRHGFKCPKRGVEVCVYGERIESFFIWPEGKPGTLAFSKSKEPQGPPGGQAERGQGKHTERPRPREVVSLVAQESTFGRS